MNLKKRKSQNLEEIMSVRMFNKSPPILYNMNLESNQNSSEIFYINFTQDLTCDVNFSLPQINLDKIGKIM